MAMPLLLDRLLHTPHLERIVPHLPADTLHRVIQQCGLEDCGELVALATPEQIALMLDADVWSVHTPGTDEAFDVARFGLWLEVLMQSGAAIAAEKIAGIDVDLIITGMARHVAVFDPAAVSSHTTLDGEYAGGRESGETRVSEVGGYVVEARRPAAWEAIVALLLHLDAEDPQYFHRLMRGCLRLSNGAREADGFHDLLDDLEQDLFDRGARREARRATQGYVTPAQARAFLQAARALSRTWRRC